MESGWRLELLIWARAAGQIVGAAAGAAVWPVRTLSRASTIAMIAVVGMGALMWWAEHQPLVRACNYGGVQADIVHEDSGWRLVDARTPGMTREARWELLRMSAGGVIAQPRFEDGTGLDPVRWLSHTMHVHAHTGAELPDMGWIRAEFSKIVARDPVCMATCPRCAELIALGDGPTKIINPRGCVFQGVFWAAVVGLGAKLLRWEMRRGARGVAGRGGERAARKPAMEG